MKISKQICIAWLATVSALGTISTHAQANDPFIGELMLFGGNFCPRGYEKTDGQLLAISSNTALFSILGTMYGGDGRTTFGLPDLRGRAPISTGQGPGLTNFKNGQQVGAEQQTITVQNMPSHKHNINVTSTTADKGGPTGKYLAAMGTRLAGGPFVYSLSTPNETLAADAVSLSGGSQPIAIRAPSIAMQWCIATLGLYPPR